MQNNEVAYRLKVELKLKKRVRASHVMEYTDRFNVKSTVQNFNGMKVYDWTENQYQQLKQVFEP